jgi:hypothetical protein
VIRVLRGLCCATWWACACLCLVTGDALAAQNIAGDTGVVLFVTPTPKQTQSPPTTPELTWSTGNGSPGIVTLMSAGFKEFVIGFGSEEANPVPLLAGVKAYELRLYSTAPKRKLLARLRADRGATVEIVGRPLAPRQTSPVVDRILQLTAFGWIAVGVLLASLFVIEIRRGY